MKLNSNFMSPADIKRQQDSKSEVVVENLDRCQLAFSKKQTIMGTPAVNEFYSVKAKHPIADDQFSVTVHIRCDNPLVQVVPEKVVISKRNTSQLVQVKILQNLQAQTQELFEDRQYLLEHRTVSKSFDFHKLLIKIPIYRLSVGFAEAAAAGANHAFQLGNDEIQQQIYNFAQEKASREKAHFASSQPEARDTRGDNLGVNQVQDINLSTVAERIETLTELLGSGNDARVKAEIEDLRATAEAPWICLSSGLNHAAGVKSNGALFTWGLGDLG